MNLTTIQAIKQYFAAPPHGREVTNQELRALTKEEREELARLAAAELGAELVLPGPTNTAADGPAVSSLSAGA